MIESFSYHTIFINFPSPVLPVFNEKFVTQIAHLAVNNAVNTVATNELLCLNNAGTQISMFFISNEYSAPMAIGRIKILGAVLELPATRTANHAHFP